MRDVLMGNTPVFWMHETEYLWMCLATTVGVFFVWSYLAERGEGTRRFAFLFLLGHCFTRPLAATE